MKIKGKIEELEDLYNKFKKEKLLTPINIYIEAAKKGDPMIFNINNVKLKGYVQSVDDYSLLLRALNSEKSVILYKGAFEHAKLDNDLPKGIGNQLLEIRPQQKLNDWMENKNILQITTRTNSKYIGKIYNLTTYEIMIENKDKEIEIISKHSIAYIIQGD